MTNASEHAVALIEPNQLLAEGLKLVLERGPIAIARRWRDVDEALRADASMPAPVVILLDVDQGPPPTYSQIAGLRGRHEGARIALLIEVIENPTIFGPQALNVDGVLLKSAAPEAMIKSLELIALGERFFPVPVPTPTPASSPARRADPASADPHVAGPGEPILLDEECASRRLTERERQVLEALALGAPNKMIARQLEISDATVKVHVKSILRKTGARNRTEAALWAHGANLADAAHA